LGSLIGAGFDAIFMGVGSWKDYKLNIPGEDLEGCYTGIDFLSRIGNQQPVQVGKRAAVIGGGNTAIDCARTLVRLGLEKVYIVYRRTRKEMPANEVEIVAAGHEGIESVFLAAPNKVLGDDQDRVKGLEYLKMELGEPDASGRRRPVPVEGSETVLDVDTIITAIGQSTDTTFRTPGTRMDELNITRWGTIDVDPGTCRSNVPYIFAAGDGATGPALVVDAIGGGRRAARAIDMFLKGREVKPEPGALLSRRHILESLFERVPGIKKSKRAEMPEMPVRERCSNFLEVDQVLPETEAISEAARCLNCCRLCYDPDSDQNAA
ncbi:MAG: FAD-dependent oxidoreductase, partial [Desulfosalsimonas sp.]